MPLGREVVECRETALFPYHRGHGSAGGTQHNEP